MRLMVWCLAWLLTDNPKALLCLHVHIEAHINYLVISSPRQGPQTRGELRGDSKNEAGLPGWEWEVSIFISPSVFGKRAETCFIFET